MLNRKKLPVNIATNNLKSNTLRIALFEEDETVNLILERAGADTAALLKRLIDYVRRQPSVVADTTNIYLGRGLDQMLDKADAERETRGDRSSSTLRKREFGGKQEGIRKAGP